VDELSKKTLTGLARMQLGMLLMLIVPAWSLAFWQAWLYWILSTAAALATALYFLTHDRALMRRRLEVGARAEPLPSQKLIQGVGGALVAAIYIVAGIEHRFGAASVPVSVVFAADAAVLAGFALTFRVFRENTFTASTVTVEAGQRVIASGPYAIVRHPMYTAAMLGYLATPLALGAPWALIPAALLCVAIVVRLLDEERYLAAHLQGYEVYRGRVRSRLIPGIW
jgi:protein-S-isoprenylcysteine O-methyltransferase Ste14